MTGTPKTLTAEERLCLENVLLLRHDLKLPTRKTRRNHTMAVVMLEAGLRVGEVVQLTGSDLFFNGEPVTSIVVRAEIAKNHRERIIPVSTKLSIALKLLAAEYWKADVNLTIPYAFYGSNHAAVVPE